MIYNPQISKNMKKIYLFCLVFFMFVNSSYAMNAHVADDISTSFRSGPSNKHKIVGQLKSGESITILNIKNAKNYYKIQTIKGKTGWILKSKIKAGDSKFSQIEMLESSLTDSINLIKKQANEIHRLKSQLNEQKLKTESKSNKETQLTLEISDLNTQLSNQDDSNLIRWMTHGGIVALIGVFLGLIISSMLKRKKRLNQLY